MLEAHEYRLAALALIMKYCHQLVDAFEVVTQETANKVDCTKDAFTLVGLLLAKMVTVYEAASRQIEKTQ